MQLPSVQCQLLPRALPMATLSTPRQVRPSIYAYTNSADAYFSELNEKLVASPPGPFLLLPGQPRDTHHPGSVLPGVPIFMSMGSFGQLYLDGGLENVVQPVRCGQHDAGAGRPIGENMGFVQLGKRKEREVEDSNEIIVYQGRRKWFL